jgi:hypothetical protein
MIKIIKLVFRKLGFHIISKKKISLRICHTIFQKLGFVNSFEQKQCIDQFNNPLPWLTYPAIEYLDQLDLSEKIVLEWGSGNSSLYFARRVKYIYSIEHAINWFNKLKPKLFRNQSLILTTEENYINSAYKLNRKFDVIIIDGILRTECVSVAPSLLAKAGMIIFDNAERNPELCEMLRNEDLIQIDMHGFGPINEYTWTTSLFFDRNFNFKPKTYQPLKPIGGE